jgi:hypothetical protein
MSNTDSRSPVTDALETLGMIHFKPEKRDAIHLAVEPVTAGMNMAAGQHIIVKAGMAYMSPKSSSLGIVDPFLPYGVKEGEKFWFVMKPRLVQSLRHVWEHPEFPAGE